MVVKNAAVPSAHATEAKAAVLPMSMFLPESTEIISATIITLIINYYVCGLNNGL